MRSGPNIAALAGLIGEPGRAAMLGALCDGQALPAGELAGIAGLSAQAASGHLARLVDGGLLAVERQGRHRYYRLANIQVASVLEGLATLAGPPSPRAPASQTLEAERLRQARTCYDHLAGALGVEVAAALEARSILVDAGDKRLEITGPGKEWLMEAFAIEVAALRPGRHGLACRCLDWSQRRHHVAGPLGTALLRQFFEFGWLRRVSGSRAVRVTAAGQAGLHHVLGFSPTIIAPSGERR